MIYPGLFLPLLFGSLDVSPPSKPTEAPVQVVTSAEACTDEKSGEQGVCFLVSSSEAALVIFFFKGSPRSIMFHSSTSSITIWER